LRKVLMMSEKRPNKKSSPKSSARKPREKRHSESEAYSGESRKGRPSRGRYTKDQHNEPSRGKSRAGDDTKGQTRRNSLDVQKQETVFKVSRVKGKERELVWDAANKEKGGERKFKPKSTGKRPASADGFIRLNRYIANAGICSRREADVLIQAGAVKVNNKVVTEMGVKVGPDDVVHCGDQRLSREKMVYLLLNKPKDYVTTMRDPDGRKTVVQLVSSACKERVLPVGRLDRQTTGLLLMTNDGDLAKRLTHPKHGVSKLYHIHTDKKVSGKHLEELLAGVKLEDGIVKADKVSYVGENQRELGLEIHMGKNRIVRRLMEQLGYNVLKLDRVMFAGLTKKNLPKGKYRFLTETEIARLKMH